MKGQVMRKLLSAALALTMLSTPALARDHHRGWDRGYERGYRDYGHVRARDGRYYGRDYGRYDRGRGYGCRRDSNTGGTVLGGVLGGVIGHEIDDQNPCR